MLSCDFWVKWMLWVQNQVIKCIKNTLTIFEAVGETKTLENKIMENYKIVYKCLFQSKISIIF